jgi:hypothetical protein
VTRVTEAKIFDVSRSMISVVDGDLPSWPETSPSDDPILAARGVVYSMGLSLPFWFSVAVFAWWLAS